MTNRSNRFLIPVLIAALIGADFVSAFAQESPRFREWTDKTGQFSVEAAFIYSSQGKVTLKRRDGREVALRLDRLSEPDQLYVSARQREIVVAQESGVARKEASPTKYSQINRIITTLRSADQVVELLDWAASNLETPEEQKSAQESLPKWRENASQGLLRHGGDWIPPHEIDARLADEIRLLKEAHRLIDVKNDRLALDRFKDASRVNPEGARADFYLGLLNALVASHPTTALKHFDECVDRLRGSEDRLNGARLANLVAALNNLAIAEVRTMKFDRAIRHWEEAIDLSPQTPELLQNLGLLTRMGGTGAGSFLSNRVGDKAGSLYARAAVANGSRDFDEGVGWLFIPYIDDVDGTLDSKGDNELIAIGSYTAIVVAPDLVLVTARAISGADRFRLSDGPTRIGEVVSTAPDSDLALVRFEGLNATPVRWSLYEPRPATSLSIQGFSQPGYGAVGLRALPTTLLDSRTHTPYEVTQIVCQTSSSEDGAVAGTLVRRQETVGGGRLFEHSFVGDPGLAGGVLCDARGVAYGVHLGPRSLWSKSSAKTSLAVPASVATSFIGRSTSPNVLDNEEPQAVSTTSNLPEETPALARSVFQVTALKYAPRLQWSHRIASLHGAGNTGGWASYEDRACMVCNGAGSRECPNRDCKRGRITKYRTVTTKGEGAFKGSTFTKQVPYKVACTSCGGKGVTNCSGCGGDGKR